jgi:site-specific recombinase XerD
MLEQYFKTHFTLRKLRSGLFGDHIDGFARWLRDKGYSQSIVRRYVVAACHLGCFVALRGGSLDEINAEVLEAYELHRPHCECPHFRSGSDPDGFRGARWFVEHLRELGVISAAEKIDAVESHLLASFRRWLRDHQGLAPSTVDLYTRGAAQLVTALGEDGATYDARRIRGFILDRARHSGPGAIRHLITACRSFLRFLAVHGVCRAGLDQAVPSFAGWRLASLPEPLAASEVERMVKACDTGTTGGLRDRAILLLLVRLGLRAGDVAGLGLSDIDWQDGSFVVSGKGGRETRLPLPQEVGDAVLSYLEHRPVVAIEPVFITLIAPLRALGAKGVSDVVARAMDRAGVEARPRGAHVLRHTAATQMLRQGASLYEIARVLRHCSVATSAYYAKVDVDLLKQVAQPWPEVR